jgi:hypothetical protein
MYIAWSYPAEANRDPRQLDNRFSTMTEVRRVLWPNYEGSDWSEGRFQQGIAGSLELFFWAWVKFQDVMEAVTGYPVAVFQRVDQAGFELPLDERVFADCDTLLLFGLDHSVTEQRPSPAEVEALRQWLRREGTCLVLGPHHDVGASADMAERQMEYLHHGDALVPRQQRFGGYTRGILQGLEIPVENRFGLRSAVVPGTDRSAPLSIATDLDTRGWLAGVRNFNFHMHLPHYSFDRRVVIPSYRNFRRASLTRKVQRTRRRRRSASRDQLRTSCSRTASEGIRRRPRHSRASRLTSISAAFSQLPCFGVKCTMNRRHSACPRVRP